ncbi:hypothetical protein C1Y40_05726 [Mycobacterium talmoniae]|uniref:Uncharacterized protein n=1 Tax=Mycobacterium talmoniae TaxID=1858794 RepID=A0A2S8BBT3_9MYCO|nr:hypothetical protein C1Y40_05726 [Mycobacterium talmoniae]
MLNTTSITGRSAATGQSTGITHSGWSTQPVPTGSGAATSTPAARNMASSPTPDSISR